MAGSPGALSDIVVLDLTRVLAGPYATMILGDLGASIIKIERPGSGDETREWGPPFAADGQSAYFLSINRNKQSVTVNLKTEEGRAILRDLARSADVLVENFKAGTMAEMELGYDMLSAFNPGLIYCSLTGYGQTGPYRDRPGYDTVVEAQGGLMSITGPPEGDPYKVGVAVVDITAGLYACTAILAALHERERSGCGQFIDIALFDTQLGWLVNVAEAYLVSGHPPHRYGNAHASIVPYQLMPTADGHLMLAVGNDGQFAALCHVVGRPELAADERFATNPGRVSHRDVLIPQLEALFRLRLTAAWMDDLVEAGVPAGPVSSIPEALADPQAQARGMVQEIEGVGGEPIRLVGPVPKLSRTPAAIYTAPPVLGADTDIVLREHLGYDDRHIAELRRKGVL